MRTMPTSLLSHNHALFQFADFLTDAGLDLSRNVMTMDGRWRNVPLTIGKRSHGFLIEEHSVSVRRHSESSESVSGWVVGYGLKRLD
jgi:hypothetical protein